MQQGAQQQGQQGQKSGGFLSSIFGGGSAAPAPAQRQGSPWGQMGGQQQGAPMGGYQPSSAPPQPQYAPSYQPGMFGRGGSGFLGSALTTAAGVAGGMVVGNALMGAFGGHGGGSTWGEASNTSSPGGMFDGGGVVPTDPTGGYDTNTSAPDPFGGGGMDKDYGQSGGGGLDTSTGWDGGGSDQGGGGFDAGGGFDGGGGGGFDDNS